MMSRRRFVLAGLEIGLTDVVALGGLIGLTLLAVAFAGRLERPVFVIGVNLLFIAFYIGSLIVLKRLRRRELRFLVRTGSVQLTFIQIYQTCNYLQLLFFDWQDGRVLAWEKALFGVQPVVAVQEIYSVSLTEWMFFVYVVYVVIYPVLGAVIYFKHGEAANEDYLFHLSLVNLACGIGFILFPVASPMYWQDVRALLTTPLSSGPFGAAAEWIRVHIHQPGGSIPSAHCAVATVMWFMARKYTKRGFLWLTPVILSLYVSTVYGRFHYVTDAVAGVVAAGLCLLAARALARGWEGSGTAGAGDGP
jgi:membrane-associated phospholipid phosphatase